jgi:hypothetical protein
LLKFVASAAENCFDRRRANDSGPGMLSPATVGKKLQINMQRAGHHGSGGKTVSNLKIQIEPAISSGAELCLILQIF